MPLDEKRYRDLLDDAYARVDRAFEDVDPDMAEVSISQGTLTITFFEKQRLMLTPQPSPRQLWVAFRDRAWHFNWDEAKACWMDDRGEGVELYGLHRDHDGQHRERRDPRCPALAGPGAAQLAGQIGEPAAVDDELARPAEQGTGAAAEEQAGEGAGVAAAVGGGAAVDEAVADELDAARMGGGDEAGAVARAVVGGERPVAGRDLGGLFGAGLGPVGEGEAVPDRVLERDDAGEGQRRRARHHVRGVSEQRRRVVAGAIVARVQQARLLGEAAGEREIVGAGERGARARRTRSGSPWRVSRLSRARAARR